MPKVSGEFEAKPANPTDDERKMKKIMDKEEVEEDAYAEDAKRAEAVVDVVDIDEDDKQSAKKALLRFANYGEKYALLTLFYSLAGIKDINKIESFLQSLPPQQLSSIRANHIEIISDDLNGRIKREKDAKEIAGLKRDLVVLEKLAKAVGNLKP